MVAVLVSPFLARDILRLVLNSSWSSLLPQGAKSSLLLVVVLVRLWRSLRFNVAPGNKFRFCMDWAASNIVLDADRVHLDKLSIHSLLFLAVKDFSTIDLANRL